VSGESTEAHQHFVVEPAGNPPSERHAGTAIVFLNTESQPNAWSKARATRRRRTGCRQSDWAAARTLAEREGLPGGFAWRNHQTRMTADRGFESLSWTAAKGMAEREESIHRFNYLIHDVFSDALNSCSMSAATIGLVVP
jgi:hypothetical protein